MPSLVANARSAGVAARISTVTRRDDTVLSALPSSTVLRWKAGWPGRPDPSIGALVTCSAASLVLMSAPTALARNIARARLVDP